MLLSILHGLGVRRNPMQATETYNRLIADAHSAPLGKSYGSYTLDTLSEQAIIKTINLPNLAGYLKQTQLDFLLERFNTVNGDFIIASVQPFFPVKFSIFKPQKTLYSSKVLRDIAMFSKWSDI